MPDRMWASALVRYVGNDSIYLIITASAIVGALSEFDYRSGSLLVINLMDSPEHFFRSSCSLLGPWDN